MLLLSVTDPASLGALRVSLRQEVASIIVKLVSYAFFSRQSSGIARGLFVSALQ